MKKQNMLRLGLVAAAAVTALAGCKKEQDREDASRSVTTEAGMPAGEDRTVRVMIDSNRAPFTAVDQETGKMTGYEYELLKLIDEKLTDYQFTYSAGDSNTLRIQRQAGSIRIFAGGFTIEDTPNDDYVMGKTPTYTSAYLMAMAKSLQPVPASFDELVASKAVFSPMVENGPIHRFMLHWTENHEYRLSKDRMTFSKDAGLMQRIETILSGKATATVFSTGELGEMSVSDQKRARAILEELNIPSLYLDSDDYLLMLRKQDTYLALSIDKAMKELAEDGSLGTLRLKWFGESPANRQ